MATWEAQAAVDDLAQHGIIDFLSLREHMELIVHFAIIRSDTFFERSTAHKQDEPPSMMREASN